MTPRVTVVMAMHNAQDTLAEAIESVLNQSFEEWELLIVDDASQDSGLEIALSAAASDSRIRVIPLAENVGSGRARNVALERASGELVAVLDADDICLPNRLEAQVEAFDRDPNLVVLGAQVLAFGTWGGPLLSSWPTDGVEIKESLDRGKMPIAHCAAMYKLAAARGVGGYDEACRRAQDFALMLRLRREGRFSALGTPAVLYRTQRPLPLRYAIRSGRDGELARRRNMHGMDTPIQSAPTLPKSFLTDLKSTVGWIARRRRESRS